MTRPEAPRSSPPDPRRPAQASADVAVGCVGRSIGVAIIAFLLLGSVAVFLLFGP